MVKLNHRGMATRIEMGMILAAIRSGIATVSD
jgi:hypothetical protein